MSDDIDDEDDMDGLPPADPRFRVHIDPTGNEPLTEDEIRRFNIKSQEPDRFPPKMGGEVPEKQSVSAASRFAEIMVQKFPNFDPSWSEALQDKWFTAYERLLKTGLV